MGRIYRGFLPKRSTCQVEHHVEGIPYFAFTDGTAKHPASHPLRRAGWAAVVYTEDGVKLCTISGKVGTLDSHTQTVFAGELLALVQVKRLFPEVQHLYCDNLAAVSGAMGGPSKDRVLRSVHKVRAHQTKPEDSFEAFLWAGNAAADLAAKQAVGASLRGEDSYRLALTAWRAIIKFVAWQAEHAILGKISDMEDIPKGNWLVMPPSSKETKQDASWVAPPWLYTLLDQALYHTAFQPAVNPVKLQAALSKRCEVGVKRPHTNFGLYPRLGDGHQMRWFFVDDDTNGSLVACDRCGAYAVRHWSTKLRSCCTGRGASLRLSKGLHPQPACAAATMPGERAFAKDIA
eukprot:5119403-Amphidinium_carterae.1